MPRSPLMFTRPNTSCGKVFYPDRRAAEEHRIVLEVWNRATGGAREGYRLAVYQCVNCGGFHVGQKRIEKKLFERVADEDRRLVGSKELSYLGDFEGSDEEDGQTGLEAYSPAIETHPVGVPPEARFDWRQW